MSKELIKVQKEYIEFIGKILSGHELFMANRGMPPKEEDVQKGKDLRKRIELLEKEQEEK